MKTSLASLRYWLCKLFGLGCPKKSIGATGGKLELGDPTPKPERK